MDIELSQLKRDSIQVLPDAKKDTGIEFYGITQRGPLLEAWGSRLRERQLRNASRQDYLWMIQGAFAGVMKRIASTPWEIKGPDDVSDTVKAYYRQQAKAMRVKLPGKQPEDIEYWQEFLRQADFGRGWGSFIKKGVDFLRQDGGWYWEIIAPGDTTKAPTGAPTGLAHLDSLRVVPTGDPEYPALYYDKRGKLHRIHHTRVVQLVDMPDGDELHPGYGLCALSRAIAIANRQVLMGRYIESSLDDKPKPGIMVAQGMNEANRAKMLGTYREDQARDEMPPWGKTMWAYGMDKDTPVTLTPVAFSVAPEKFDFKMYTELDVNALALAIGVDKQELWELTSSGLGSGAQSEIMQQKSRGKAIGDLLTSIERALNDILPEDYTFEFKKRDAQEEMEAAQNAQAWASAVASMQSSLSMDEQRILLANTVEQVREAVTDEKGQIQRRDDLDVQQPADITAADNTAIAQPTASDTSANPQDKQPPPKTTATKAYPSTLLDFEGSFEDLVSGALKGDISRGRFAIVSRALLKKYGRLSMLDGLKDGGIETDELDSDDMATFTVWLAENSSYLSDFADRIYKTDTNMTPAARAEAWGNKSLRDVYQKGLMSADKNGLYEWVYGDVQDHCETCRALNSQRHRLKDYAKRGLLPGSDLLSCGGYNCACKLVKAKGSTKGRWPTVAA